MEPPQLTQVSSQGIETKIVTIFGHELTLEKRVCLGGCKKEFWVCPESQAVHARSDCLFVCNVPIDDIPEHIMKRYDKDYDRDSWEQEKKDFSRNLFAKTNSKTKPPKKTAFLPKPKRKPKEIDTGKIEREKRRWNIAVYRVRRILQRREAMPRFRESVACIASAVVKNKKNFSIKCFSSLVGLDRKTLQCWIHVKSDVLDHLTVYDGNFLAAKKTREILKSQPDGGFDMNEVFIQESIKCMMPQKRQRKKEMEKCSNGSSITSKSGRIKAYRMKIKIKSVS
jgi:hypothetical protein